MKSIEIKGSLRTETGKKATHSLRKNNAVPVSYTHLTLPTIA